MRRKILQMAGLFLFVLASACEEAPNSATAAPIAKGLSSSEAATATLSWEDYYDATLQEIGKVAVPSVMPSVTEDSKSFLEDIDLAAVATSMGETLPKVATRDDALIAEYRFPDSDSVVRARRDKQSLRFYFGEKRSPAPADGETTVAVSPSIGVALADQLFFDLGLPVSQKGEVATEAHGLWLGPGDIEKSTEEIDAKEKRWEDSRIVFIGREVGGWRVHHSKVVLRVSNSGEMVSGRVNWPAFVVNGEKKGAVAKSAEEIAQRAATELESVFRGKPFEFSAETEMMWVPRRDGTVTTFEPAMVLSVSSKGGEDPFNEELYIGVY